MNDNLVSRFSEKRVQRINVRLLRVFAILSVFVNIAIYLYFYFFINPFFKYK